MTKNTAIDKELSQTISIIRIPLAIMVIFGHSDILSFPLISNGELVNYNQSIIRYPIILFSQILFGPAVPLFFMISGYLFFFNCNCLDKRIWASKLKKRMKTLLVPYLLWNILYVIYTMLGIISKGQELDILQLLSGVWSMAGSNFPADPALWFVRDLIIIMFFSPVVDIVISKRYLFIPFILTSFSIWMVSTSSDLIHPGFSVNSILFFTIGGFLGKMNVNVTTYIKRIGGGILFVWITISMLIIIFKEYPVFSTDPILLRNDQFFRMICKFNNFLGCISFLFITILFIKGYITKNNKSDHSFIIFSAHMMILMILAKFHDKLLPMEISSWFALLIYFANVIFAFLFSIAISILIHKNKLATFLFSGGR